MALRWAELDAPGPRAAEHARELLGLFRDLAGSLDLDPPPSEPELRVLLQLGTALADLPAAGFAAGVRTEIRAASARAVMEFLEVLPEDHVSRTAAARFFYGLGLLEQAQALLEGELARLDERAEAALRADVLANLAQVLGARGDEVGARDCLERAQPIVDGLTNADQHSFFVQFVEGERLLRALAAGRPDLAFVHWRNVSEAARTYTNEPLRVMNLLNQARLLLAAGALEALCALLAGEADPGRLHPELGIIQAIATLKSAYPRGDDLAPGIRLLRRALVRMPISSPAARGWIELVEAQVRAGDLGAARSACAELGVMVEELASRTELAARWRRAWEALDAVVAWKSGAPAAELRTRLRALERSLAEAAAQSPSGDEPAGLGYYGDERLVASARIWLALALGDGPEAAVECVLMQQAAHDLARALAAPAPTLVDVRRSLLSDGHGVLLYYPVQPLVGDSLVFAFDRTELRWATIGDTYRWEARQRELDHAFTPAATPPERPDEERARRAARSIGGEVLPAPIVALAGRWARWTVVGANAYGELPFDGLEIDGIGVVGLEKEIEHCPSLAWALARRERRSPDAPRMLFVAALDEEPGRDALLKHDWRRVMERSDHRVLVGSQVSIAVLRALSGENFRLATILAHGGPDESGLGPALRLLADGGEQPAAIGLDTLDVLPRARVFLLGICRAGSGSSLRMNAGMSDFGGALLGRGAEAVILGTGDLALGPTSALLARVHGEILDGRSPSAALRVARRALVEDGLSHPSYHARLRVFGLGHALAP